MTEESHSEAPGASEDRGKPVWVWVHTHGFTTFAHIETNWPLTRHEVSAPIGWVLGPHPDAGAMMRNTFGEQATARQVLDWAIKGERGFKVREETGR